jgi:serine phosphatase RsbU (regulator of sigma subunit)
MNEVLQNQTAGNFITAFYGIYDPDKRTIRYANAGHPLPYLITKTEISQLPKGNSTALALFSNELLKEKKKGFVNFEAVLPASSKLLFYTDGLLEATPSDNTLDSFELIKLSETFREIFSQKSKTFINKLFERLVEYRGSDSFEDDICLVCFDIN